MWVAALGLFVALVANVAMSLLGDELKGWVGRVPNAILWIATRRVPSGHRDALRAEWTADLVHELRDRTERPLSRLLVSVRFASSLVLGGRRVALELGSLRTTSAIPRDITSLWLTGMPSQGPDFIALFRQLYGVDIHFAAIGSDPDGLCRGVYRDPAGAVITCTAEGACGTTYWHIVRESEAAEPIVLIRCRSLNEDGRVLDLRIAAYD
jgi:hypothetical protein